MSLLILILSIKALKLKKGIYFSEFTFTFSEIIFILTIDYKILKRTILYEFKHIEVIENIKC